MLTTNTRKQSIESKLMLNRALVHAVLLGLVLLLGTTLRIYDLGAESYWLDEITMVQLAQSSPEQLVESALGGRPPVYVVAAYSWAQLFGTSETATRSLSAVFGIAALAVMYLMARELFGKNVALLSTFFMALSEVQIYHAQNFRYYSLLVLLTLVSFLFFLRFLREGRKRDLAAYVVASILMYYTHSFGVFAIAAQHLFLILQWRRYLSLWPAWIAGQVVIGVALAASLLSTISETAAGEVGPMSWIPIYPLWYPLITLYKYVFPARDLPALETMVVAVGFLVVGVALFVQWIGRTQWSEAVRALPTTIHGVLSDHAGALLLTICWLLSCVVVPFALTRVVGPIYIDRYTIGASPALYMLLAVAIVAFSRVVPQVVSVGLLVILIVPGLQDYYVLDIKEQWDETAAYIEANWESGDTVVYAPGEKARPQYIVNWYAQQDLPGCNLEVRLIEAASIEQEFRQCTAENDRFWLVLRGPPRRIAPFKDFFLGQEHVDMRLVDQTEFTDIAVYLFEFERE